MTELWAKNACGVRIILDCNSALKLSNSNMIHRHKTQIIAKLEVDW